MGLYGIYSANDVNMAVGKVPSYNSLTGDGVHYFRDLIDRAPNELYVRESNLSQKIWKGNRLVSSLENFLKRGGHLQFAFHNSGSEKDALEILTKENPELSSLLEHYKSQTELFFWKKDYWKPSLLISSIDVCVEQHTNDLSTTAKFYFNNPQEMEYWKEVYKESSFVRLK